MAGRAGSEPSKSYVEMVGLFGLTLPIVESLAKDKVFAGWVDPGYGATVSFAPLALMIAIAWEESLFNNIAQQGSGTAVGYGQVEPAELFWIDAKNVHSRDPAVREVGQRAMAGRYAIYDLPARQKTALPGGGSQTTLLGKLTELQSIGVVACSLRHLYEANGRTVTGALRGYAGFGFKGPQPEHLNSNTKRQAVIDGWLGCAGDLFSKKLLTGNPDQEAVLAALNKSRPFGGVKDAFRKKLFPGA